MLFNEKKGDLALINYLNPSKTINSHSNSWNEGLEIARAFAILLVVFSHGLQFLKSEPVYLFFNRIIFIDSYFRPGWWGVRIFFGLSGYLIGRQVIHILSKIDLYSIYIFTIKRLLRTVPTYWLILLIFCVFSTIQLSPRLLVYNAFFLQNILPDSTIYNIVPVAWSLLIEEWSYAFLSLFLLGSFLLNVKPNLQRSARNLLLLSLMSISLSVAIRNNYSFYELISWSSYKKTLLFQFDSLSAGILLASIEILFPGFFKSITNNNKFIGLISIVGMTLFGFWLSQTFRFAEIVRPLDWQLLGILGYPTASFLSIAFICSLWQLKLNFFPEFIANFLRLLSSTSYSLYLVHLPMAGLVAKFFSPLNNSFLFIIYISVSISLGYVSWLIFEKPFLYLRKSLKM